jgi:hypothetical protein
MIYGKGSSKCAVLTLNTTQNVGVNRQQNRQRAKDWLNLHCRRLRLRQKRESVPDQVKRAGAKNVNT